MIKLAKKLSQKTLLYIAVALLVLTPLQSTVAHATDTDFYSRNDILYYDPDFVGVPCSADGSITTGLIGSDNPSKIFNYFVNKGLTPAQAAGFLGNLQAESGFNPSIEEGGRIVDENYNPINGVGFGLVQWTFDARQLPLEAYAKETNRKINDLSLQLDYIWKEITDPALKTGQHWENTLENLKKTSTPIEAATAVHYDYERSGAWPGFPAERGVYANDWFTKLGASASSPDSSTGSSVMCGDTNGVGIGDYMSDSWVNFNQCDAPWGTIAVAGSPSGTACWVACGPTSMAMIIKNMTGKNITPTETIQTLLSRGQLGGAGSGFDANIQLGTENGLKGSLVSNPRDFAVISDLVKNGSLVVLAGIGAAPFDLGAHFVIVRGITNDGKLRIADPAGRKAGDYEPNSILPYVTIGAMEFHK